MFFLLLICTDPDPNAIKVLHLKFGNAVPVSNGTLATNATWEKPSFNYSAIAYYLVSYVNGYNKEVNMKTVRMIG